jgi:rhamnogalacturonyl hydrolase YesR
LAQQSPTYPVPYQVPTRQQITDDLERIRVRLDAGSPTRIIENPTGREVAFALPDTRPAQPGEPPPPVLDRGPEGKFAQTAYPMGVAYAGMLSAADATGDPAFNDFVVRHFQFFADNMAKAPVPLTRDNLRRNPFRNLLAPAALDDCGAIGAAFIKARRENLGPDMMPTIDRFAEYITHGQFRLPDGTLARENPFKDSLWADDMYMSVPFLAQMGALTGDGKYFDDACKTVLQLSQRLFVPSVGLYTHISNTFNADNHPHYFWGRANGWCMMAMVELLDVLPRDHPSRPEIIKQLRAHAMGVASLQSGNGLWHQMLDRTDSYTETSASAMFCYAMARAVNKGWLDAAAYGPVAEAAWNGLSARITSDGRINGTCVGTSYADDYIYYYNRPQMDDVHGYGPVLLAGSEMIRLLGNDKIKISQAGRGAPVYYLDPSRDNIPRPRPQ